MKTAAGRRALAERKLRQARRLHDAALDHHAVGDELLAECARLVDEVVELEAGRDLLPQQSVRRPDTLPGAPTRH